MVRLQDVLLCVFSVVWLCASAPVTAQQPEVNFSRQIKPLLARRCFACHGPDKAEAGLRLNSLEAATKVLESGHAAIVPGNADTSELLRRVASTEEHERMPPEGTALTAAEQALLRTWIAQGGEWNEHWAFEPIKRPDVPATTAGGDGAGSSNSIDAFIDASLSARGLKRSPRAEPLVLLRRLYFDLIGLPPTPAQVTDFLQRATADFDAAWRQEVDSLLASPHYGERWARHWLDVVRYAETNSFERDGAKPNAWRYRDYVIRAFNEDKPYDQFLLEQLAGDELPEVTRDSLVATGFYRLGIWDDEPADRKLAVYEGFDDILTTVGQGVLGLTINCARCHDHKIDPIPAADYYSTLAFFRNLTPNGYGPQVERPLIASEADRAALAAAEKEIRERSDALQMRLTGIENDLKRQFAEAASAQASSRDLDDLEYRFYRDTFRALPDFDSLKAETTAKLDPPVISIAPATRPDDFGFVFTGTLIVPADGEYQFTLDSDDGSRLILDGNKLLEYDGIHGLGDAKTANVMLRQGRIPLRLEYFQGQFGKGLQLFWSGPGFKRRSLTAEGAASGADLNELLRSPAAASVSQETIKKYRDVRRELEDVKRRKPWEDYGLCVSEHGTQAPETFVLLRGSPEAEADKVEPQFLSVLGGGRAEVTANPAANTTGRRLAFARWVVRNDNRLTSRVFVNRLWQHHFGRGIVRSPNNFGQLGEAPTHPELLDWLASEFMARGWSMKAMHRLILTSAAWQQSSLASADALQKDPVNDLFSRFDLRRLSAEEVRDSVLAVNGRLNRELFGPSIYTKISQEVLAGQSVPGRGWGNSSPEEQARRSIYIHVKRSLLVPMLSSFDFPEPDVSCEARFVTTQPGQALAMLNGDFLNEQSVVLADRLRKEAPDNIEAQLRLGLQLALSRNADDEEIRRGLALYQRLQQKHNLTPEQALNNWCLFVFNLNEFIYVD
jgi:cytochrome c553